MKENKSLTTLSPPTREPVSRELSGCNTFLGSPCTASAEQAAQRRASQGPHIQKRQQTAARPRPAAEHISAFLCCEGNRTVPGKLLHKPRLSKQYLLELRAA